MAAPSLGKIRLCVLVSVIRREEEEEENEELEEEEKKEEKRGKEEKEEEKRKRWKWRAWAGLASVSWSASLGGMAA